MRKRLRHDMISQDNSGTKQASWLPILIHTTLIFVAAPLLYWALICVQNLPLHFGMLVTAAFGIPDSYVLCGLPLLAASAVSARLGLWLSSLGSIWCRLALGAVVGCILRLALESYFLWHLRGSQAYQTFSIPCSFEGAFVGLCSPGIWRLSCRVAAFCRGLPGQANSPDCDPGPSLGDLGGPGAPRQ
jgi:hypothetical protein